MWMLYTRAPTPNAAYWPGRKWLALIDALAWPSLVIVMVAKSALDTGVVGPVSIALCGVFAVRRCVRALWRNERYRFTTWTLGAPLAMLLAIGTVLKAAT
jgi:hypothetical protein